jgi:ribosome biogenesis GTPase
MRGTVLHGTGGVWHVRVDDGRVLEAALRGRVKHAAGVKLAVGDDVLIRHGAGARDAWAIAEILPRRSQLVRRAPTGHGGRVIVANLDQVVVVFATVKPEPHIRMLDRFLVIAEANDLVARVVVNKTDIAGEQAVRERFGHYEGLGYPLHATSTKTRAGLDSLHDSLRGKASAFTGPSGVGKSSLLNAMYPSLQLRVGAISESVNKGRHTTVGAWMHPLPDGGYVIDTPGLREIGMWGVPSTSLDDCFPEMRDRRVDCDFANCRHVSEPRCAVRDALSRGEVHADRYESYCKLLEEARQSEKTW